MAPQKNKLGPASFGLSINPPANAGDSSLIPRSGRSHGEGNGNPLQYSSLRNTMERGACWTTVGHNLVTKQQQSDI